MGTVAARFVVVVVVVVVRSADTVAYIGCCYTSRAIDELHSTLENTVVRRNHPRMLAAFIASS